MEDYIEIININFINHLYSIGASISISIPDRHGACHIELLQEEILDYSNNPDLFIANKYDVDLKDYINWKEEDYSVRCSAITRNKARCKNLAISDVTPLEWVKHHGEYCYKHKDS